MTRKLGLALTSILFLLLCNSAQAGEFPTGALKGIGFKLERGNVVLTEKDLYQFELSAMVEKIDDYRLRITTKATMQKTVGQDPKIETRIDTYKLEWSGEDSGVLKNEAVGFKDDESTFKLVGKTLTIKSWIPRNQLWETHVYEIIR